MNNIQSSNTAQQAAIRIQQKIQSSSTGVKPKLGLILGSGLGGLANLIQNSMVIPYKELPGFPEPGVEGHSGLLHLGKLENCPVACLQGRGHLYEGISPAVIPSVIRTLKLIGCEMLLITCSAGSMRPDIPAGSLMAITDHINLQFSSPLVGPNDPEFGPRFVAMEDAYDPQLRNRLATIARRLDIPLAQGVYIGVLGPSFETPAEIRAFRTMGADAVGMSTVHEVIIARHCGLRVAAISAITNMAAGMSETKLSHQVTLEGAESTVKNLAKLILAFVRGLEDDT